MTKIGFSGALGGGSPSGTDDGGDNQKFMMRPVEGALYLADKIN